MNGDWFYTLRNIAVFFAAAMLVKYYLFLMIAPPIEPPEVNVMLPQRGGEQPVEMVRPDLQPSEAEPLREVLYALRERNLPRIANVYRDAFAEVKAPTDALRQALDHLDRYFKR